MDSSAHSQHRIASHRIAASHWRASRPSMPLPRQLARTFDGENSFIVLVAPAPLDAEHGLRRARGVAMDGRAATKRPILPADMGEATRRPALRCMAPCISIPRSIAARAPVYEYERCERIDSSK